VSFITSSSLASRTSSLSLFLTLSAINSSLMLTNGFFPLPPRPRQRPSYNGYRAPRPTIPTDFIHPVSPFRSCPPSHPRQYPFQTGRHRPPNTPYAKPPNDRNDGPPQRGRSAHGSTAPLTSRLGHGKILINPNLRRDPVGTPPILRQAQQERAGAQKAAHSKLNEKLGSDEMKNWLRGRVLLSGVMDMSVSRCTL